MKVLFNKERGFVFVFFVFSTNSLNVKVNKAENMNEIVVRKKQ